MPLCRVVCLFVAACGIGSTAWARDAIRLVDEGRALAVIVIPSDGDGQTKQAAETLAAYVKKSSGADLPILDEHAAETDKATVQIHVGPDRYVQSLSLGLDKLDADGFVIRGVDPRRLVIVGPTAWGTEFGVYEFLEHYLGVRWLMPGPEGEDVPVHRSIDIPIEEIRQEPAFFSRLMSGFRGTAQELWARRLGMHGRVQFHHNLYRLIPPRQYTKTHPEFFPVQQGKRYLPPDDVATHWQPCFSAPGLVDEAVKNICRHFEENPSATSYSLGVNDSGGHCECEACRAKDPGRPNFVGRRDMSDAYYAWCNQVVEGVLKKYPDKYFGCLAYSEVAGPPSKVKLHPRLIPFMTYDRMKWIDPGLRAEGEAMTRRWAAACSTLGWYDYIYGVAYCVPRVWFHQMAEYYRTGYSLGVQAMYAEAYPCWGEGPKLYVAFKLQWDPSQDVDKLLREWYVRTVGESAAGDLAAYYTHWEDFWTRRILQSRWFTKSGQYLAFHTPTYLVDVTDDDMAKGRELMDRVVAKAQTPQQKARAKTLMLAFEYYEASALAYRGNRLAEATAVQTEANAIRMIEESQRTFSATERRRRLLLEEFPRIPALQHSLDFDRRPNLEGANWGGSLLWTVFDWAGKSQAVRQRLQAIAGSASASLSFQAKTMLALVDRAPPVLSKNASFEEVQGRWPAGWSNWITDGAGRGTASPNASHSGKVGLMYSGVRRGGPHQMVEVTPGRYAATALVRVPKMPQGNATIALKIVPLDERGANLPGISTTIRATACEWTRLAAAGELAAEAAGHRMKNARLIVILDGFGPGEDVQMDEVGMYRLE